MFLVSKLIGLLLSPSFVLLLLLLLALILMGNPERCARRYRAGFRLATTCLLLLAIVGLLPIGKLVLTPLENRFDRPDDSVLAQTDVIVVLGGAVDPSLSVARNELSFTSAAERLNAALQLSRRLPKARILITGGNGELLSGAPEALFIRNFLAENGVAQARITIESNSRNTFENAVNSINLMASSRESSGHVLLITSASHMPRAMGSFRHVAADGRAGKMELIAYPVDYRTGVAAEGLLRAPGYGWAEFDAAVHEWIGLVSYYLMGNTDALLPG